MISDKKVLALIPARANSKGLPKKNILELVDKPLIAWPIQAAKGCKYIDRIIVSTDCEEIAAIGREYGADIPFKRPSKLATDHSTTQSVIEHTIKFLNESNTTFDYLVLLEPTSPLTTPDDIEFALEKLEKNRTIADSIVGLGKVESTHPNYDVLLDNNYKIKPFIGDIFKTPRRQELEDIYFMDGSLYISDIKVLIKLKTFYHDRTLGHLFPKHKSFEIDDYIDFICIRSIIESNIK